MVLYNDNEPYCVRWLQRLRDAGHMPPGLVDGRDIRDLTGDDLQ